MRLEAWITRHSAKLFGVLGALIIALGAIAVHAVLSAEQTREEIRVVERQVLACNQPESERCQRVLNQTIGAMSSAQAYRILQKARRHHQRLVRQERQERRERVREIRQAIRERQRREGGGAQQTPPASQRPSPEPPGRQPPDPLGELLGPILAPLPLP